MAGRLAASPVSLDACSDLIRQRLTAAPPGTHHNPRQSKRKCSGPPALVPFLPNLLAEAQSLGPLAEPPNRDAWSCTTRAAHRWAQAGGNVLESEAPCAKARFIDPPLPGCQDGSGDAEQSTRTPSPTQASVRKDLVETRPVPDIHNRPDQSHSSQTRSGSKPDRTPNGPFVPHAHPATLRNSTGSSHTHPQGPTQTTKSRTWK